MVSSFHPLIHLTSGGVGGQHLREQTCLDCATLLLRVAESLQMIL